MQSSFTTILRGAVFFGLTVLVAIVGYWMAGWELLDAIYMTTITIFGVGYGEVRPMENDGLRVFTMFVIIAGCSSAVYVIGGFVQLAAEGEINRVLGARRMTKGIEQLANHTIVCGYGRVGLHLARELSASQQSFIIVDTDTQRLRDAEAAGFLVLVGDATEEQVLRTAGIERARVVASVLSDDAANVFLTLTARELNPKVEIIARAESVSTEKKLLRSGANRVVLPTAIGATRIANLIARPSAEMLLDDESGRQHFNEELRQIGLKLQEFPLNEGSELIGRPISQVEISAHGGFVIVALRRASGEVIRNPESRSVLQAGDMLLVLGHSEQLLAMSRRAATARGEMAYRGAKV